MEHFSWSLCLAIPKCRPRGTLYKRSFTQNLAAAKPITTPKREAEGEVEPQLQSHS